MVQTKESACARPVETVDDIALQKKLKRYNCYNFEHAFVGWDGSLFHIF